MRMRLSFFVSAMLSGLTACGAGAATGDVRVTKSVIHADPAAPNLLRDDRWRPWQDGFVRRGEDFTCDNGDDRRAKRGLVQTVTLNQTQPQPIVASAWSQAEDVSGQPDHNYAVYLDITFLDGTHAWGRAAAFSTGSHGWERREVVVVPKKPVSSVSFYLLFRRHSGKARFRDPRLQTVEAPAGATLFDGVPVALQRRSSTGFQVRDVAAGGDYLSMGPDGNQVGILGLQSETTITRTDGVTFFDVRLRDVSGKDRAVTLVYTVGIASSGARWLHDPRREEKVVLGEHYWNTSLFHAGSNGRLSRYPLGAVTQGKTGTALAIDMMRPAFFRIGYNSTSEELYLAYDVALTPEKPEACVRFCRFSFDAEWGFRGALERFYGVFPSYFQTRVRRHGLWMPFARISRVQRWRDFGFRFKEGTNETAWDDAHGILTFRYTEPMTWWMPMPDTMPRTLKSAEAHARRLALSGDVRARAWLSSAFRDEHGRHVALFRDEPWNKGAVWSVNSMPRIQGSPNDFETRWNSRVRRRYYQEARAGDVDGEYVDSSEGYVTAELDFRREHFSAAQTPLCYSLTSRRPGIFRGLIAFEYIRAIEKDMRRLNKLMMANATPSRLCWLIPMLDVAGTETDWNRGGAWRPMSDAEMLYRRSLCRGKPFCFLMNTDFDRLPPKRVEDYMKRCLAYGMFPGFFSPNASEGHYFSRPELYNRDRRLFQKYIPLCRLVSEAGWEPVTRASSSHPSVYVERFGNRYWTVYNDASQSRDVVIRFVGLRSERCREHVREVDLPIRRGEIHLKLEPGSVALLDLNTE